MELKDKLNIWQQNINKSPACQHDLVSSNALSLKGIDIMALQEPPINAFGQSMASKDWYSIYPTPHNNVLDKTRSMMLISANISTDAWCQVEFPSK
jgi:hypothetical protein